MPGVDEEHDLGRAELAGVTRTQPIPEDRVVPFERGGTDEALAEAAAAGTEAGPADPAHAGAAVTAHDEPAQKIEVDVRAPPWLVDLEHDRKTRKDMMAKMVSDVTAYDHEEDSMIQCRLAMLVTDSAGKVRRCKSGPTVDSSSTRLDEESGLLVGNTQLVIRGAGPLDIIAYLMDPSSAHWRSRLNPHVDVRFDVREVRNAHHIIFFYECKIPPFQNRTLLNSVVWKKLSESEYVWCGSPITSHPLVTPMDESHAVRAEGTRCIRLTVLAEGVTNVEYACTLDLKGHYPAWLTNRMIIPTLMALPYNLQVYFAQIRPIDDCVAPDGACIGHMLMNVAIRASRRHRAEAVASFISRTAMLQEAPVAHLDTLLQSLICNESHHILAGDVATQDPTQLTVAEAHNIGDGITVIRRGHMVPTRAVAEVHHLQVDDARVSRFHFRKHLRLHPVAYGTAWASPAKHHWQPVLS